MSVQLAIFGGTVLFVGLMVILFVFAVLGTFR